MISLRKKKSKKLSLSNLKRKTLMLLRKKAKRILMMKRKKQKIQNLVRTLVCQKARSHKLRRLRLTTVASHSETCVHI